MMFINQISFILFVFIGLLVQTFGEIWDISDTYTPEQCYPAAAYDDHVLIEFSTIFHNGTVGTSIRKPDQLFHLVLQENDLPVHLALFGMCKNQTRRIQWNSGKVANFSPIPVKARYDMSKLEEPVSISITVSSITTEKEYGIFEAFREGNTSRVMDFIDDHIAINAIDEWGQTPLMVATINHNMMAMAALLNTRRPIVDVNMAKSSGFTTLFYAIQHAPISIFQGLLRRGADPHAILQTEGAKGNTPLHYACLLEKLKHAELLVEYGANPTARNQYGVTPLQMVPADAVTSMKLNFRKLIEVHYPHSVFDDSFTYNVLQYPYRKQL